MPSEGWKKLFPGAHRECASWPTSYLMPIAVLFLWSLNLDILSKVFEQESSSGKESSRCQNCNLYHILVLKNMFPCCLSSNVGDFCFSYNLFPHPTHRREHRGHQVHLPFWKELVFFELLLQEGDNQWTCVHVLWVRSVGTGRVQTCQIYPDCHIHVDTLVSTVPIYPESGLGVMVITVKIYLGRHIHEDAFKS